MRNLKIATILYCLLATILLKGQNLEKANSFYKDGYYARAIPIYEAAIRKRPSNAIKSKLANSYRILNQANRAAILYKEIILDDKAEAIDFFRYGEVLMMQSKYDSAKVYFQHFGKINPEDERGVMMLKAIDKMKEIRPVMSDVIIEPYKHNTDADENVPVFYKNGLAFATDRNLGFKILKEKNQTTGREYFTLFYSEKSGDTAFTLPKTLSHKFTELNKNTGNISFTKDGKFAFFCRNSNEPSKNDSYNMQLYSSEASDNGGWRKVKLLPFCNKESNYMYPAVSPDGKQLFFVADRGDGFGGLDIYVSTKTKKGGWSKPENLGININTSMHEGFPFFSEQGKLYFCSKGHPGFGGYDIFVTEQDTASGEWKKPQNLGPPINSAYDDISISFADTTWGAFTSNRSGRGDDIFFFKAKNAVISPFDSLTVYIPSSNQGVGRYTFEVESKNPFITDAKDLDSTLIDVELTKTTESYLSKLYDKMEKGELKVHSKYTIENIRFDSIDASKLTETMKEELDKLTAFLLEYDKVIVEIGAHTEGIGDRKALKLGSQKLAEAMAQYLIDNGIRSKQLLAKGYGNVNPIKDCRDGNCSMEDDLKNRRVELKIIKI